MATGSIGLYRSSEGEALEMTTMLAKKEPEVDTSGSSYNTPNRRSSWRSSPQRDLFNSSLHRSCCLSSDNYCLFVSIQLERPSDETTAGVPIPAMMTLHDLFKNKDLCHDSTVYHRFTCFKVSVQYNCIDWFWIHSLITYWFSDFNIHYQMYRVCVWVHRGPVPAVPFYFLGELPYWFKTSFWPKIFGISCTRYCQRYFYREVKFISRGQIEPNIEKLEKLLNFLGKNSQYLDQSEVKKIILVKSS